MAIGVVVEVISVECLYPPYISKRGEVTRKVTESFTT
jgi:hypothetical protein